MTIRNHWITGVVLGAVVPALTWFVFDNRLPDFQIQHKPGIPHLIALAVNLFIIRYCFKTGADRTGTGAAVTTFIYMVAIFVFKIKL